LADCGAAGVFADAAVAGGVLVIIPARICGAVLFRLGAVGAGDFVACDAIAGLATDTGVAVLVVAVTALAVVGAFTG
jgi:hypothetical protein